MQNQAHLQRAAKRLADINHKIANHRARIPRLPPGVRGHAGQVLASYEASRVLFEQHYQSLGGKVEDLSENAASPPESPAG